MSYLDRLGPTNIGLIRRFENASAHAPLCHLSEPERKAASREVATSRSWEAVSPETRALVEAAEKSRELSLLHPTPFLAK